MANSLLSSASRESSPGGGGYRLQIESTLVANGLVKRYGKGTDSDATDTLVVPPLMFGSSRGGPNSLRAGFTGDGHIVAQTLKAQRGRGGGGIGPEETLVAAQLTSGGHPNSNPPGRRKEDDENLVIAGPLCGGNDGIGRRSEDDPNLVTAFDWQAGAPSSDNEQSGGKGRKWIVRAGDYTGAIGESRRDAVAVGASVRRLMPVECERLQALPDGWTDLGGRKDSPRYAALGDAVTASVAEWIGRRIAADLRAT